MHEILFSSNTKLTAFSYRTMMVSFDSFFLKSGKLREGFTFIDYTWAHRGWTMNLKCFLSEVPKHTPDASVPALCSPRQLWAAPRVPRQIDAGWPEVTSCPCGVPVAHSASLPMLHQLHANSHRCSRKFREVAVLQDKHLTNLKRALVDQFIPRTLWGLGWAVWSLTIQQSHWPCQFCNLPLCWCSLLPACPLTPHFCFLGWTSPYSNRQELSAWKLPSVSPGWLLI